MVCAGWRTWKQYSPVVAGAAMAVVHGEAAEVPPECQHIIPVHAAVAAQDGDIAAAVQTFREMLTLFREGVRSLLSRIGIVTVVAETGDGREALELIEVQLEGRKRIGGADFANLSKLQAVSDPVTLARLLAAGEGTAADYIRVRHELDLANPAAPELDVVGHVLARHLAANLRVQVAHRVDGAEIEVLAEDEGAGDLLHCRHPGRLQARRRRLPETQPAAGRV